MTAVEVLAAHHLKIAPVPLSPYCAANDWTATAGTEVGVRDQHAAHQLSALADAGFRVVPAEAPRSDLGGLAAREAGA